MTNENNTNQQESINTDHFIGGAYLKQTDLAEPVTVTISDAWTDVFRNDPKRKIIIAFHENVKPLILNTTNTLVLRSIFGSKDAIDWRGPITLYREKQVQYSGQVTGGIRVRPAELQTQPQPPATAPQVQQQPQQTQQQPEPQPPHPYSNGAAAEGRIRRCEADVY